jgi:aspartyl-tRNA(Asn)/glutamyl-tRNA(Gln) amidotransferase subunit C
MKLSRLEVENIAELAKLRLRDDEIVRFQSQLSAILDYVEMLAELDTGDVPPTTHVLPLSNVLRDDEVGASMPREDVLANAPDATGDCFRVPLVLEESNG